MKTISDVVSIILFVGIAILYLQRSASNEPDNVAIWKYAAVAVCCAVSNTLGNNGHPIAASVLFAGVVVAFIFVLKPFGRLSKH
jgi:hypothetical protein